MKADLRRRIAALPCWRGKVAPRTLGGGITNLNFLVEDCGDAFVVRAGGDIPVHQVMRFFELAVARGAHTAGISPEIVYSEPGIMVMRHIAGKTLTPADFQSPRALRRAVALVRRCHREVGKRLQGPALAFWVFHLVRNYARILSAAKSPHAGKLPRLLAAARALERAVGPVSVVLAHNDLLAANFIDDGRRLWLIDWEYAGFNSPLFDLGNLAVNNDLPPALEEEMLAMYFGGAPADSLRRSYAAMKCAAALREAMWSMVSEIHSRIDFDYGAYTADFLGRFNRLYRALRAEMEIK